MDSFAEFALRIERMERLAGRNARLQKRYIRDMQNPFDFFRDTEFLQRYRFPKEVVRGRLLEIVRPHLVRNSERGLPIPPVMKLLIALRFYASSSYQVACGDLHGVSQPSVSLIIKNVSKIFGRRLPDFIKMPTTAAEVAEIALQFHEIAGFPEVLGAIDGTHIMIKNPGGPNAEAYRNSKGYFSINVQVIANPSLKIMDIVVRRPGSCHDARVFDNSSIRTRLEEGHVSGLLVGDSSYPCREYLFTPILRPASRAEERYNRRHVRTRNVVERAIGLWKQRFPCLRRGLGNSLKTAAAIICAVAVLHNIAIDLNIPEPDEDAEKEEEVENLLPPAPHGNGANARYHFVLRHFTASSEESDTDISD